MNFFTYIYIIELWKVKQIRNGYKNAAPNTIKEIIGNKKRTCLISPDLFDDFHKYAIMDDLERILDFGLYLPESSLGINSKETIRGVLDFHQVKREKVLRLVDKSYRSF